MNKECVSIHELGKTCSCFRKSMSYPPCQKCIIENQKESLLDCLNDDPVWNAFIDHRKSIRPDDPDTNKFVKLSTDSECRRICCSISMGEHTFSVPRKKLVPKNGSRKMRTVYQFTEDEMMSLRILSYLLHSYDYIFTPDLYSFRSDVSVGYAVRRLHRMKGLGSMWGYKADIHNYFNSIDVGILLPELKADLGDDRLYNLFESILSDPRVQFKGQIIEETKGVMAGVPISAFLANYFLTPVDRYFGSQDCVYMRYADDILILSDSEEGIRRLRSELIDRITSRGLEMNPDKEWFFRPGEPFEFLGFSISEDAVDISAHTVRKMKGKIRRSARSIRRWMIKKHAPVKGTIRAFIRDYNHRLYGYESGELSWSAWYLRTVTTTESLHEIDLYMQDWIRYIATGHHNKKNFDVVPYTMMKTCGYSPLVSEYYAMRKPVTN